MGRFGLTGVSVGIGVAGVSCKDLLSTVQGADDEGIMNG